MAAMLCWKPLMDVTRRQILGLGVVALGALRLPTTRAFAATGPDLFELALDDSAVRGRIAGAGGNVLQLRERKLVLSLSALHRPLGFG